MDKPEQEKVLNISDNEEGEYVILLDEDFDKEHPSDRMNWKHGLEQEKKENDNNDGKA